MKTLTTDQKNKIVKGIVNAIIDNKRKNAAKGNDFKGLQARQLGLYPYLQETYGMTPDESYKAIEALADQSKKFHVGRSRVGAILYLPEDYKPQSSVNRFENYLK